MIIIAYLILELLLLILDWLKLLRIVNKRINIGLIDKALLIGTPEITS